MSIRKYQIVSASRNAPENWEVINPREFSASPLFFAPDDRVAIAHFDRTVEELGLTGTTFLFRLYGTVAERGTCIKEVT